MCVSLCSVVWVDKRRGIASNLQPPASLQDVYDVEVADRSMLVLPVRKSDLN